MSSLAIGRNIDLSGVAVRKKPGVGASFRYQYEGTQAAVIGLFNVIGCKRVP